MDPPTVLVSVLSGTLIDALFLPIWVVLGALCGVTLADPERGHRHVSIFNRTPAELSRTGVVLYVGTAFLTAGLLFPAYLLGTESLVRVSALAFYGPAVVAFARHWPPTYLSSAESSTD